MNTIKTFEEFINENSKSVKVSYQDDDYSILDKTFKDIDLSDIPIKELRKQYVDFETLIVVPPTFGDPLFKNSKKRRLNEGVKKSFDIQTVRKSIMKKYELKDWQFKLTEAANEIKIALIVPHLGSNNELVIEDMKSLGYYDCDSWFIKRDGMIYAVIRFDPQYPKDITNEVGKMQYIKHLTPRYNVESIKKNGFIPLHKNDVYKYPPRIHFFKDDTTDEDIDAIGQDLCESNSNSKNNGEYVLFTLDVSKIPNDVKFIGDSCCELAVCTEDAIPYDTVVEIEDKKYKK